MRWIASSEKDTATTSLEKHLWDAADQFRANSGLKAQEYSGPILGLIFDYKGHWPMFSAKRVVVPSQNVCSLFGDFVAPLSHQILKLERTIDNLRHTRDLLMPRLLSGQLNLYEMDQAS